MPVFESSSNHENRRDHFGRESQISEVGRPEKLDDRHLLSFNLR
jgi:hypothetical protein